MQNEGARYNNVRKPPEGVETAETVIRISNDLVYNCLVDTARIDQLALMPSKDESQQALLVEENGRSSIRGGNIREVHFLPNGDYWQVFNGAVSMTSNRNKLRELIGVDRTTSIRQTENELEQLSVEIRDLTSKSENLKKTRRQYKVQWNELKKEENSIRVEMQKLEEAIERLQEEAAAAENVTLDTKEYEDDVKEAEKACDDLRDRQAEIEKEIENLQAPIRDLEAKVDETRERSKKVSIDLNNASEKYAEYLRSQQQRDRVLEKKRSKVAQVEEIRSNHIEQIEERTEKTKEAKQKAQQVTYQISQTQKKRKNKKESDSDVDEDTNEPNETDYELIEPIDTNKPPDYWKTKIQRGEKEIENERKRREISEVDPEVALEKYQRAKKDLENKMVQVRNIEQNQKSLVEDLKDRKRMWRGFRSKYDLVLISQTT